MSNEIRIYKEKRILEVWENGKLTKEVSVGLGFTPKGAKSREGDGKTPEGDYYICTKNPKSKFTLFLGLSYPNTKDVMQGLERKLISKEEADEIISALEERKRPNWYTGLGGEIGIHGKGHNFDWTAGCIALDDEDIHFLWDKMDYGDLVKIMP